MARTRERRGAWAAAVLMAASAAVWSVPPATAAPPVTAPPVTTAPTSPGWLARQFGLQRVPKTDALAPTTTGATPTNPLLSLLPDPTSSNLHGWRQRLRDESAARTAQVERRRGSSGREVSPLVVDEREPDAVRGQNDTPGTAELIPAFGSAREERPAALVRGTLAPPPIPATRAPSTEDDGSVTLAEDVVVGSGGTTRTTGRIGDGPHGSDGDGTGDFDYYALRGARAGQTVSVDIDTPDSELDSVLVLWDAAGEALALSDDDAGEKDSHLRAVLPRPGDYVVSVQGFGSLPEDPFDSGSGRGAGSEGSYTATFGVDADEVDHYAFDLRAGDVLSSSVTGAGTRLAVHDPAEREVIGSTQDLSSVYPLVSPLAGGGNAVVDHVAATSGRYDLATRGLSGDYEITLEVYRPGPERRGATQTVFLDVDGARVNTAVWGGPGVRQLSPLSTFLSSWGLEPAQQDALVDRVVATVTENLERDLAGTGAEVEVLNSRDHEDPFGGPEVTRLVIGGSIAESGIETIGIAQSIDPGNFDLDETALVLLDAVSEPAGPPYSLNTYLEPGSDRVRFVGTALGDIASHEAGHLLGSYHVDQLDEVPNLMDQGGDAALPYGVGPDGVGGTGDDLDVDFGTDTFVPNEGFTGLEDTRARTRWALTGQAPPDQP